MTNEQCKKRMNQYAANGTPFFFLLDFELIHCHVYTLGQMPDDVFYDFQGVTNVSSQPPSYKSIYLEKHPVSLKEYSKAFDRIQSEIRYGNSYLVNLTFANRIETNLNLKQLFHTSRSKYKLLIDNTFLSFSPETFITIENNVIRSCPMKGTIDANLPDAEKKLLGDIKEQEEHNTIVDLIRNDLSHVANKVEVSRHRYLDTIKTNDKTLIQMSSEIQGSLKPAYETKIGDIVFSLLPAGSISGAPKKKTIEIIQQAENRRRGYYTGIMGLYDGQLLDTAVLIRCIEKVDYQYYYHSGGGITHRSDPDSEYEEMINKIYVPIN